MARAQFDRNNVIEKIVRESTRNNYSSCLLVKTQLELAAEGNELYYFAAAKPGEVEALFRSYLENEFSKTVSRRRAASIMLHIFGMRVYGYQRGSADRMRQGLHEGLPWLPWD
jgi:TetR/AcrR family transcriptional repressor of nem operon